MDVCLGGVGRGGGKKWVMLQRVCPLCTFHVLFRNVAECRTLLIFLTFVLVYLAYMLLFHVHEVFIFVSTVFLCFFFSNHVNYMVCCAKSNTVLCLVGFLRSSLYVL